MSIPALSQFSFGIVFSGAVSSVSLSGSLTGPTLTFDSTLLPSISLGHVTVNNIFIDNNQQLTSLGGGSGSVAQTLRIRNNQQLSTAAATAWAQKFSAVGSLQITFNKVP